ncbi:abasic site processing protein HMCES-like isoform X1 [Mytilus galloprovincialis]|uniref:abasic site processing protein HMCES-like isoform X1 n=1 Tax=Mytilus galloprovincialis TaxID=29158 RepID=UPI003F7B90F2
MPNFFTTDIHQSDMYNHVTSALEPDDICKSCSFKSKTTGKGRQQPVWRDPPGGQKYYPSYNVAPGSHTPVLISSQHYQGELDTITERVIQPMRWGLVPSWHKGDPTNVGYETNNCRAEGMLEKKTYKVPLEKGRRCVVLADGFYEWKRDQGKKQPYFIYSPQETWVKKENSDLEVKKEPIDPDQNFNVKEVKHEEETEVTERKLLMMAGVFDVWHPPDNSAPVYSYSVITVESSPAMSWIHHRMPAILTNDAEIDEWINFAEVPLRGAVQNIRPTLSLQMHPVTTAMGNSRYKSPDCVQSVDLKKPKAPVNSLMKNWLSQPKKEQNDHGLSSPTKSQTKSNSSPMRPSPTKQSKSSNLMMNWLQKGKREPDEDNDSPAKKIKTCDD